MAVIAALSSVFNGSVAVAADPPAVDPAADLQSLQNLSIQDLTKIDISSVSRKLEPLSDAPAAIYVITHDDVVRSGATTIPEMLRLAPNLQVAQASASSYAITARGFNGALADKLLVLIDGRTVYTPLYAGLFWDQQEVLPQNIERIEVISGPGATLWGANAVNGVINIITRKSSDTQGGLVDIGGGNLERGGSLQYGGKFGSDGAYRVYGTGLARTNDNFSSGITAEDAWNREQGGFRVDWSPPGDLVTVQGDYQVGGERQLGTPDLFMADRNVLARWTRQLDAGSTFQLQAYYDEVRRFTDNGGGGFALHTYNVDMQHSFPVGDSQQVVWGVGERVNSYAVTNTAAVGLLPASRSLNLADVFVQDTISLAKTVNLTVAMKLEDEPFTGLEFLPSVRASWKPTENSLLWSAVSRAVRAPTPFDRDLFEKIGPITALQGSSNFTSETLTAFEFGTRIQPSSNLSFSISNFYNIYDQLRSIEFTSAASLLPLQFGNMMEGNSYGTEFWGTYRVTDGWRLMAGANWLHENLRFKSGSSGLGGIAQAGDDPHYQFTLRSSVDLSDKVTFDASLRGVAALPNPVVPAYTELNTRLGWQATDRLLVSLTANNLLHAHHVEFAASSTVAIEVGRSFYVRAQWKF